MRKPIMAGNWKMYKTIEETQDFFNRFLPLVANSTTCDVVLCPTFVNLQAAAKMVAGTRVQIGGQNLFWAKEGAYTGEISAGMLRDVGCKWVLIAHSERRQYFGETDEEAYKKIVAALEAGLTPIVCIGEQLAERDAGQTEAVLGQQFRNGIGPLSPEQFSRIVIAYEPVWAIGTGKTATPEIAESAHRTIRAEAQERFGSVDIPILYGGSVKPDNVDALMAKPDLNGALVGGASLDPASFARIVNYQ